MSQRPQSNNSSVSASSCAPCVMLRLVSGGWHDPDQRAEDAGIAHREVGDRREIAQCAHDRGLACSLVLCLGESDCLQDDSPDLRSEVGRSEVALSPVVGRTTRRRQKRQASGSHDETYQARHAWAHAMRSADGMTASQYARASRSPMSGTGCGGLRCDAIRRLLALAGDRLPTAHGELATREGASSAVHSQPQPGGHGRASHHSFGRGRPIVVEAAHAAVQVRARGRGPLGESSTRVTRARALLVRLLLSWRGTSSSLVFGVRFCFMFA